MFAKLALSLTAMFVVPSAVFAQENLTGQGNLTGQENLTGLKCIVDGNRAAVRDSRVAYRSGVVYFSSPRCAKIFEESLKQNAASRFSVKANHQLVLSGQYVQKACPIDGGDFRAGDSLPIAGTTVGFGCRGSVEQVLGLKSLARQAALVFADEPFVRGFKKRVTVGAAQASRDQ